MREIVGIGPIACVHHPDTPPPPYNPAMLPTITHRLMMAAAITLGTLAWLLAFGRLLAPDGSAGISLMDARSGTVWSGLWLLVAGLPALAGALYLAAAANPLSGVFSVGFSLMILAGFGGSAQGLYHRQPGWGSGSGGAMYIRLEIELALWAAAWCLLMFLMHRYRETIRSRWVPGRLRTSYTPAPGKLPEQDTPKFVLHVVPILAGLFCAALGWLGCVLMIQSTSNGQVIGSILFCFTVASLVARLAVPTGNALFLVLSPLLTGFVAYAYSAVVHADASATDLIGLLHGGKLLGPAMALPIHWASAGMVGVAAGIGVAQAIDRVRFNTFENPPA